MVAVVVPIALGYERNNRTTQVGAFALMYSLPWACLFAATAWLNWRWSLLAVGSVVLSAFLMWAGPMIIPAPHPQAAVVAVIAAASVTLAIKRPPSQHPTVAHGRHGSVGG
jgi:hypothetical protein